MGLFLFTVSVFAPVSEELVFRGLLQGWLRRASLMGQFIVITLVWGLSINLAMPQPPGIDKAGQPKQAGTLKKAEPAEDKTVEREDAEPQGFWNDFRSTLIETNWSRVIFTTLLVLAYFFAVQRLKKRNMFLTEADFLPSQDEEDENDDDADDAPRQLTPAEADAQARWKVHDHAQQRAKAGLAIFGSAMCFGLLHPPWPNPIALFLLGLILGWLAHRTQNLLPGIVLHALFNTVSWIVLFMPTSQDANGNAATTALRPPLIGSMVSSSPGSWLPRLKYANPITCLRPGDQADDVTTPTSVSP